MKNKLTRLFPGFALLLVSLHLNAQSSGVWIPEGSQVTNLTAGAQITPPEGYLYVGYDTDGKLFRSEARAAAAGTTISCDCTGTGSCMPFSASGPGGTTKGCAGECTACKGTQSARSVAGGEFDVAIRSGGYINLDLGVRPVQRDENLPGVFAAMLELPEVVEAVNQFLNNIYGGKPIPAPIISNGHVTAPAGHRLLGVNIAGRGGLVVVPEAYARAMAAGGSGGGGCSCTQGTCTEKSKSVPFVGSVTYCEGNCTGTCSLSARAYNNDVMATFSSYAY